MPMKITINGNAQQFDEAELSLNGLLIALNLMGKRLAIEKNGEIVPRSQFAQTLLQEGDQIEIVGAVGGG
jgi:sulfur carrier protein